MAERDPLAEKFRSMWEVLDEPHQPTFEEYARAAREHIEGPIRALHKKSPGCFSLCAHDGYLYPCPTIRALGGSDG